MGYIQDRLVEVLNDVKSKQVTEPVVGSAGWAPTPRGLHHLWPCLIVAPSDPLVEPGTLQRYHDTAGPKMLAMYFLGEIGSTEALPINVISANDFVAWGSTAQDFVEMVGAIACAEDNAVITANFLRSVEEGHAAYAKTSGTRFPCHKFTVGWSALAEYPMWPCVTVSPTIAQYFNGLVQVCVCAEPSCGQQ
jgi:hypothetical protein